MDAVVTALGLAARLYGQYKTWRAADDAVEALIARLVTVTSVLERLRDNPKAVARNETSVNLLLKTLRAAENFAAYVSGELTRDAGFWKRTAAKLDGFVRAGSNVSRVAELHDKLSTSLQSLEAGLSADTSRDLIALTDLSVMQGSEMMRMMGGAATHAEVAAMQQQLSFMSRAIMQLLAERAAPPPPPPAPAPVAAAAAAAAAAAGGRDVAAMNAKLDTVLAMMVRVRTDVTALQAGAGGAGGSALKDALDVLIDKVDGLADSPLARAVSGSGSGSRSPTAGEAAVGLRSWGSHFSLAVAAAAASGGGSSGGFAFPPAPVFSLSHLDLDLEVVRRAAVEPQTPASHPTVIAAGAGSTVLRAKLLLYDPPRLVAVKVLAASSRILAAPDMLATVQAQVSRQCFLNAHPNAMAVYGLLRDDDAGVVGMVMECCNTTLCDSLYPAAARLSADAALNVLCQLAEVLAALHQRVPSVVHGDIKAANVLVTGPLGAAGSVKVYNFRSTRLPGLDAIASPPHSGHRRTGTPLWRAPEQFTWDDGDTPPTTATDVYSFGMLMWEVLAQEAPFTAAAAAPLCSTAEVRDAVVSRRLRPDAAGGASRLPAWVSAPLTALMRSCWAADPASRPTMPAVAAELVACAADLRARQDAAARPPPPPPPPPAPGGRVLTRLPSNDWMLGTSSDFNPYALISSCGTGSGSGSGSSLPLPTAAAAAAGTAGGTEGRPRSVSGVLKGHTSYVNTLAVLDDGTLASGSSDGSVRLYDPVTHECGAVLEGSRGWVVALAVLRGNRLAVGARWLEEGGSTSGAVTIYDTSVRPPAATPPFSVGAGVRALVGLPDGRLATGNTDATVYIRKLVMTEVECTLSGHKRAVCALALLPGGRLASGSADATIRVWDTATAACVHTLPGHSGWVSALAVLRRDDGRTLLASGSRDNTMRLWDLGDLSARPVVLAGHHDNINALAALPHGNLASGDDDGVVKIWDTDRGVCVDTHTGHTEAVNALVALPRDRLASASADLTILITDLA